MFKQSIIKFVITKQLYRKLTLLFFSSKSWALINMNTRFVFQVAIIWWCIETNWNRLPYYAFFSNKNQKFIEKWCTVI